MQVEIARIWMAGGIRLLQYRNKLSRPAAMLSDAREIVRLAFASGIREQMTLIMNDRADLVPMAEFDGVHVGQEDLSPAAARFVIGSKMVGLSCHDESQIEAADASDADYLAIGPVFATASKANPDPTVGVQRLRSIRKRTSKPLVAIGGITRENARSVWDAGADSVAVISDLARDPERDLAGWSRLIG